KMVSLGEKEEEDGCNQLTSLRILELLICQNLERCKLPNKILSVAKLVIIRCDSIASVSFPIVGGHKLKSLKIYGCEQLLEKEMEKLMLELGFLEIGGLKKPISKLGPQNFPPSLVELILWGGSAEEDDVSSGSPTPHLLLTHMLPSSLTRLALWNFEKLESVSMGLQHLTSLQHLFIHNCPKIEDLPEKLLPSLLTLTIYGCPDNLKEKISRRGSYWPLVSYIPCMELS
ncbi:NB-ARC domains-containing protein, partial [Tanacetum coccineum]